MRYLQEGTMRTNTRNTGRRDLSKLGASGGLAVEERNPQIDHIGSHSRSRSMSAALVAIAVTIGSLLLNTTVALAAGPYAFYPLNVQFPDGQGTTVYARNAHGDVVGFYYANDTGRQHGFLLRNGSFSSIDAPDSFYTVATGINDSGDIVGYYGDDVTGEPHGFLLSGGIPTKLDFPFSTPGWTVVTAINNGGQIVGYFGESGTKHHAFLWNAGSFSEIDLSAFPADIYGPFPTALNDSGQVVGVFTDNADGHVHGFAWTAGTVQQLDLPGSALTQASGISNTGDIFGVAVIIDAMHGFVLSGGVYALVDYPGAVQTVAWQVNSRGEFIGQYYLDPASPTGGFVAFPAVAATIDIKPGDSANAINLRSSGTVPVAMFSSASFDAKTVDPLTVTLASAPVKLRGKGTAMASFEDVNRDGRLDLVVHVDTSALQASDTDVEVRLQGRTYGGIFIVGTDSIRVTP
jgi:probable HAF family extracellular repeat protein